MYEHVLLETTLLGEGLSTMLTAIWIIPVVYKHVLLETIQLYERLGTLLTVIWLLPCVYQHVRTECWIEHTSYSYITVLPETTRMSDS